jgi:hypothetical protein
MPEPCYSYWTCEERTAFEVWLKMSIEMIEKYCKTKEAGETESD